MSDIEDSISSTSEYSGYESSSFNKNDNNILLDNISSILESLIEENKNLQNYKEKMKFQKKLIFYSREVPSISIKDYLYRINNQIIIFI